MNKEFTDKLSEVRSHAEGVYRQKEGITIEELLKESMNELEFYESAIPKFFSHQQEANNIKSMYNKLHNISYSRNKVVNSIDVSYGTNVYLEYYKGMREFADNMIDAINEGNDTTVMESQLQTALQGDTLFIESLFGGDNNKTNDEVLTEAVKNVEYLIDFMDVLNTMKLNVKSICEKANDIKSDKKCITEAVGLVLNSTGEYCNKSIITIMETYENINMTLNDEVVNERSTDTFKLF